MWRLWLAVSTGATLSGLALSAIGQLNAAGYAAVMVLGGMWALAVWRNEFRIGARRLWQRRRRWRRAAPLSFLVLAAVAGLGGALYAPVNYDTLWYRLPRVLHWLAEGRWHWIHTHEPRVNFISTGIEWLWTPLVAWARSDRLIFLPNIAAFVLLPGLVFSLFTRLGMRARVAWWWMWLVPAGWIFSMQAGSAANDAYGATYALLMVDLALRARRGGRVTEWWWAMLAVALLTNAKQNNAPLGLIWLLAAAPAWRLPWRRPWATLAVGVMGAWVSMVPTTFLNWHFSGEWMGWTRAQQVWVPFNPLAGVVANAFVVPLHNLLPPLVPGAAQWNVAMVAVMRGPLGEFLRGFDYFAQVPNSVTEAWAGLGLPLVLLALTAWLTARRTAALPEESATRWLRWAIWPLLVLFMAKMGSRQPARYFAAYYPFMLVAVLAGGGQLAVIRRKWWRPAALGVIWVAIGLAMVSRQRPVLPPPAWCEWLARHAPAGRVFASLHRRQMEQLNIDKRFPAFVDALADQSVIGFAACSIGEVTLWQPWGQRRVRHVTARDSAKELRALGVRRVIVNDMTAVVAGERDGLDWIMRRGGRLLVSAPLSPEEVTARALRGEPLQIEGLALQKAPVGGGKAPVDNFYLYELPLDGPDPAVPGTAPASGR